MGAHRALVGHVRRRVLAGQRGARLAEDYRATGAARLRRLERGLDRLRRQEVA